jgi:hypothetical protein
MSPVEGGMECEPVAVLAFEMAGAPPAGAEGCWGVPDACPEDAEVCPEGAEGAAGCAVDPVGAGVNPTLADIEGDDKGHSKKKTLKKSRHNLGVVTAEQQSP